jgi:hypothetical protein
MALSRALEAGRKFSQLPSFTYSKFPCTLPPHIVPESYNCFVCMKLHSYD